MGCNIFCFAERKNPDGAYEIILEPFNEDYRSYSVWAFLAGIRNYSRISPISVPRGIPDDFSGQVGYQDEGLFGFGGYPIPKSKPTPLGGSWLGVKELTEFDYDAVLEDMRNDDNGSKESGHGVFMTYREYLGETFMGIIKALEASGADRVVFWFDD